MYKYPHAVQYILGKRAGQVKQLGAWTGGRR
jgi:hypothetical protein